MPDGQSALPPFGRSQCDPSTEQREASANARRPIRARPHRPASRASGLAVNGISFMSRSGFQPSAPLVICVPVVAFGHFAPLGRNSFFPAPGSAAPT